MAALWRARGWWGGLAALAIAVWGQYALVNRHEAAAAGRAYTLAAALLAVALCPWPLWARRSATAADHTARASAARPTLPVAWLAATLALGLAMAAALLTRLDDPLGAWLWFATLGSLYLTARALDRHATAAPPGVFATPAGEASRRGVPRLPAAWEGGLAAGLVLVALVLRVQHLGELPGIFGDEGERGMDARAILEGHHVLLFGAGWWGVPNLYFYCVAWLLRVFGDGVVGLRMLSALSGTAAVWCVYRIGRLLWGARAGLIAGALLAVSPLALQFSRVAGESTPTGALWAAGFLFFCRALRGRRWQDWVLAGTMYGLSLYFYAAGKLVFVLLAAIGVYCTLRWRRAFLVQHGGGFLALCLAFGVTFFPYAVFSAKEGWQAFGGRAQETSIFAPQNRPLVFAAYHLPYDPAWAGESALQAIVRHPLSWAQVLLLQLRTTTDVLYRRGDPTVFYAIRDHAGAMLSPALAAMTLLGLFYATLRFGDARFGLTSLWFWAGLLGAALTIDTPSVQRIVGAWPAVMLFPAALLDRIWAAAWPLSAALARRWATLPLAALVVFAGIDGYQEYFVRYAAQCPYCGAEAQARYVQALGQTYKSYQLGVGEPLTVFGYGSTRFAAKGAQGVDLAVPADYLPLTDNHGKGVAFLVYPHNADYLPLIRLFYPAGVEEPVKTRDGVTRFTSYRLAAAQMAQLQTLRATYTTPLGTTTVRDEPNLGTGRPIDAPSGPWEPLADLPYPLSASWQGGLVAPAYGRYVFVAAGDGAGRLEIDGAVLFDEPAGDGTSAPWRHQFELVLAKGAHPVRFQSTLADPWRRPTLQWGPPGKEAVLIGAQYLTQASTGGLSGEAWPAPPGAPAGATLAAVAGVPASEPTTRRIDPALGYQEGAVAFGPQPFIARWQGTLTAPADGRYVFETVSTGASAVYVDGQPLLANPGTSLTPVPGEIQLRAGPHSVEIRYAHQTGPARLEWYWTPPGGSRALVPPTVVEPLARQWLPAGAPAAPPAPSLATAG